MMPHVSLDQTITYTQETVLNFSTNCIYFQYFHVGNGHLKVVKFLIKSGANIFAKNSNNRTPREEAEVTLLRISENEDLAKTVSYLVDYEEAEAA